MGTILNVLIGRDEGKSYELEDFKTYTIGRASGNDIKINDRNVSRYHLKIISNKSMFFIRDLHSKNGTFINGKDIPPGDEVETKEGVPIVIGLTVLGIGEICESTLKPFLDATGIFKEISEGGRDVNPYGAKVIRKYLEFIYDIDMALDDAKNIYQIADCVLDRTFRLLKRIDRCVIVFTEDKTGNISKVIYRSRAKAPVTDINKVYNHELVQKSLTSNKPIMISDSDIGADHEDMEDIDITQSLQFMRIRSAMCVPIRSFLGTRGAIYVDSIERPNGFRGNDLALLKDVSGRTALAMDNLEINKGILDNNLHG